MDPQDSSAAPFPPPHHQHHRLPQQSPMQQQQHHHLIPGGGTHPINSSPYSNAGNAVMMHPQNPNPRFAFGGSPPNKPLDQLQDHHQQQPPPQQQYGDSSGGWFNAEPAKKKRGRPRKYSPDNKNNNNGSSSSNVGLGLATANNQISADVVGSSESKKHRGRPPGSGKKQMDALGVPGVGFTPHVIIVEEGEDIASKLMAFAQEGPRTVCILSAHGAVSNVTLRQRAMPATTMTYEGRFNIISLAGSFSPSDRNSNGGGVSGLNISLAGTDAKVLGGGVSGVLRAASTVQVILGSFIEDGKRGSNNNKGGMIASSSNMLNFSTPPPGGTGGSSSSPEGSEESVDEENDESALERGYPNPGQPMANLPMYPNMAWR